MLKRKKERNILYNKHYHMTLTQLKRKSKDKSRLLFIDIRKEKRKYFLFNNYHMTLTLREKKIKIT